MIYASTMLMTKSLLAYLTAVCFSVDVINAYRQPLRPRKQQRHYNNAIYNKKEGASATKNGPMKYYGKQKFFEFKRFNFGSSKHNIDTSSVVHRPTTKDAGNNYKQNNYVRSYRKKATNKKKMVAMARPIPRNVRNKKKWKKNVKNVTKPNQLAPKNKQNPQVKYTANQRRKYAANQQGKYAANQRGKYAANQRGKCAANQRGKYAANQRVTYAADQPVSKTTKAMEPKRVTRKKRFKRNKQATTIAAITLTTFTALPETATTVATKTECHDSFDDFATGAELNDNDPEINEQTTTERTDEFASSENHGKPSENEHADEDTTETTAATSCPQSFGRSILKLLCDSSMRPLIRAPFHLVGLLGKTSTTATTMNSEVNADDNTEDSYLNRKDSDNWDYGDFTKNEKYESATTDFTTEAVDSVTESNDSVTTIVVPREPFLNPDSLGHVKESINEESENVEDEITTPSPSHLADDVLTHLIVPNKYADSHSLHNYYCFPP